MRTSEQSQHVVFTLDEQRYALPLFVVERVVRVVEVTPLPEAPEIVLGVINLQGRVIPVVNIRKRFHLPERETNLSDQLIIAQTAKRTVALVVDAVAGLQEHLERDMVPGESVLPTIKYVDGVARMDGGLVIIHDLDRFLSLEEEESLDNAIREKS